MDHDENVAKVACCVQAGAAVVTQAARLEKERLPARLDQSLRNLKMPILERDIQARFSIFRSILS